MKSGNKVFFSAAGIAFAATITMAQSVAAQDNPQQVKNTAKIGALEMKVQTQEAQANVRLKMLQNKIETMQVTVDEMKGKIDKLEGDVAFLRRIRK
jgi:peptidoglycan hydrolase CwlO-like protein